MSKIVVYGAGGRAGRRVVTEATRRGHDVTAVVRQPAKHPELAGPAVTVVAGDVTDPGLVASTAAGHDAAISAVAGVDVDPQQLFPAAASALLSGLTKAGVPRVVLIGIGTTLKGADGVPIYEAPGFPAEGKAFSLGHAAALDVLRAADSEVDWLVVAPPPVFLDDEATHAGTYRFGGDIALVETAGAAPFSYADLAAAVVDQVEDPTRARALLAVAR